MAQPTPYDRQYNFNDFATTSPSDPLPGVQVDNELNSVKTNLDGVNANIGKIQRDDGKLANQSVHKNSFDTDALALIGLSGYTVSGDWAASSTYTAGTLVDFNAATYLATVAHTAGTVFVTDLNAGKWILLANAAINTSGHAVDKFEGNGSQTQFTLSYTYSSTTDFFVFVNGALRNPNDDYTLSGTTLTLATPPSTPSVSGNENVIVWGASVSTQFAKNAAATSASNASSFATASQNSATAALASQNAASTSEGNASTSAGTASTQAGIATTKAAEASTSETNASGSASTATTQAGIATTKAGEASTSASTATTQAGISTTQATNSANSASTALSHKNDAETAKTASETAQTASETARTAAQNAQAAAEAALDTFSDKFLGAKSSDPTLDNDNNALQDGALYFDTTLDLMKVYDLTNTQWRVVSLSSSDQASVNTVAGIASNVTAVANNSTNINALNASGVISNIGLVAGSVTNVNNVGGSIANVNTVASNLSGVNSFGERYRVQSGTPASDNDIGDLVFDTASSTLKVFGASGFQNAGSSVNGTSARFHYDITSTVQSVTGSDANGNTLAYDAGFIDVYVNGVRMSTADVVVTSGDTVTFASDLVAGDEVDIVAFGTFSIANMDANNLSAGTIPDARFPSTLPAISGANLTNLDATDLTGTIASARVSGAYTGITGTGTLSGLTVNGNLSIDGGTIKLDGNFPTGSHNVALGDSALSSGSLSGSNNVALGSSTLASNTNGAQNIGIGRNTLDANTDGANNVGIGHGALTTNVSGGNNVGIGRDSLSNNTSSNNTAVGYQALTANTTASDSTAVGHQALSSNTTALYNTAVGFKALATTVTGAGNTAVGWQSLLNNTGDSNVAIGMQSMQTNTSGGNNVAFGRETLLLNTSGSFNTALGHGALGANTTASNNVAVGRSSLDANTTGTANVGVGNASLTTNTTGSQNIGVGVSALEAITTGTNNTVVGNNAFVTAQTSTYNTAIGYGAGSAMTAGAKNTIIGCYNGNQDSLDIRTSDNNCILSDGDGNVKLWISSNRRTFIGGRATNLVGAVNITGEIGSSYKAISFQHTNGAGEVGSIKTSSGSTNYDTTSDYRLKENVVDMTGAIDRVKQLLPKRFNFIIDADKTVDGFLAHEAQTVIPEAVSGEKDAVDDNGDIDAQGIDQSKLVPLLTGALKEAIAKIEALETRVTTLEG